MRKRIFFFQAEDGIRDIGVTGVQTCALPICHPELREADHGGQDHDYGWCRYGRNTWRRFQRRSCAVAYTRGGGGGLFGQGDPEEGGVGKSVGFGWGRMIIKKKNTYNTVNYHI